MDIPREALVVLTGDMGGPMVAAGPSAKAARVKASRTSRYLAPYPG